MNTVNKIKVIKDNNYIDDSLITKELFPAMLFDYVNPSLALLYVVNKTSDNDVRIRNIADKIGVSYVEGKLVDKKNKELGIDYVIQTILSDIDDIVETEKESTSEYSFPILDMVKDILINDIKPKVMPKKVAEPEIMEVEDLMAKLYGPEEEKVGRKK